MILNVSPPPFDGSPVVVLSSGLGGAGSYWLPQLSLLSESYQLVTYDHPGTGVNSAHLPEGYCLEMMARELWLALQENGISSFTLVGHALGALIGLQMALDFPQAVRGLVLVNGWLTLSPHTRRCFAVRERLLQAGGAEAWVEAQPLFLYPAEWLAVNQSKLEAEDAKAISHFQGEDNLRKRINALKISDFSPSATKIHCPTLIVSSQDDLLVPSSCSRELHSAIRGSKWIEMKWGGHACNITDADNFNPILYNGLISILSNSEVSL